MQKIQMRMTDRINILLFNPKAAWQEISHEEASSHEVIWRYFLPLLMIPAVATFVSYGIIGYRVPFFGSIRSLDLGIRSAISVLISSIAATLISALIVNFLATAFGAPKNFNKALQLMVYSYTPGLIGGIFYFYYATSLLGLILGLYGLYLLFMGLKPMLKIDDDKQASFYIISMVMTIIVFSLLLFIVNTLLTSKIPFTFF
jgi:hypothetical protein